VSELIERYLAEPNVERLAHAFTSLLDAGRNSFSELELVFHKGPLSVGHRRNVPHRGQPSLPRGFDPHTWAGFGHTASYARIAFPSSAQNASRAEQYA
jgi:hypothetical protein